MSVLIGLDMLYVASVTADTSETATYAAAVRLTNVTQANVSFNTSTDTFFADDGPAVVATQMGDVEVSINVGDLTPAHYALLTGAAAPDGTNKGVIDITTATTPPDVAVGFRAQKANGKYRYIWLMKGKFELPGSSHQTKEGSVNFQQQELTYKAVARIKDAKVMRRVDSDDTNVPTMTEAQLATQWFETPDVALVAP